MSCFFSCCTLISSLSCYTFDLLLTKLSQWPMLKGLLKQVRQQSCAESQFAHTWGNFQLKFNSVHLHSTKSSEKQSRTSTAPVASSAGPSSWLGWGLGYVEGSHKLALPPYYGTPSNDTLASRTQNSQLIWSCYRITEPCDRSKWSQPELARLCSLSLLWNPTRCW